jgi:hypothetical protein
MKTWRPECLFVTGGDSGCHARRSSANSKLQQPRLNPFMRFTSQLETLLAESSSPTGRVPVAR